MGERESGAQQEQFGGDPDVVGKSLGKDLEKGKLTLPLIHRLETAQPADRQLLLDLLRDPTPGSFRKVGQLLAASDSLVYSRRRAEQLVDQARAHVDSLADSPARATLRAMADAVVTRAF